MTLSIRPPRHVYMFAAGSALFAALAFLSPLATAQAISAQGEQRLTPNEYDFSAAAKGGTGTSGVNGIKTLVLKGNPNEAGLYTILLSVPAHTKIAAHSHPDERVATVVSGVWRIGYGTTFDEAKLKALPPGSFYTEPAGDAHFAETQDTPVIVQITGNGPSGTAYTNTSASN